MVDKFVTFAEVAFTSFGDRVTHFLTFNEVRTSHPKTVPDALSPPLCHVTAERADFMDALWT